MIIEPPYTRDALAEATERYGWAIGEFSYGIPAINHWPEWGGNGSLVIGKYCSIASGVQIFLGGEHRTDWISTYPFNAFWPEAEHITGHPATKGNVSIGNDVWLAADCTILSGVTIGDGAVVGAGAVVAHDVAPYAIVGGNPARLIRRRFSTEHVEALLRIRWWDWPRDAVGRHVDLLQSGDLASLLKISETIISK